ncbi:hypothetical protein LY78DRAFT_41468 [Colletotrichum sublineola]|nr:hypothetical protein LY78DRAFT_41468 [Colletotrichum sublineola]
MQHNTTLGSCSSVVYTHSLPSARRSTRGQPEADFRRFDNALTSYGNELSYFRTVVGETAASLVWESAVRAGLTDARDRTVVPFGPHAFIHVGRFQCPIIAFVYFGLVPGGFSLESCSWAGALEHAMQHMQAARAEQRSAAQCVIAWHRVASHSPSTLK